MGDIIHALPAARDIREHLPDARIDWVAEESFRDIPGLSPAVEKVHATAFRRWRRNIFGAETKAEAAALKAALRAEKYDLALDIQGLMRSALVAKWTGAPAAGYTFRTVREPLASLFYARRLDLPASLGAVRRCRMAAAQALGYEIDEENPRFGLEAKEAPAFEVPADSVALAVNTSRDEKLWAEENWVELGARLHAEGLSSVLYWGSGVEKARCARIAEKIPDAIVAPRSRLHVTAAAIKRSRGLIGVDTGLAHLAAALGVPSVGIFVSTSAETLRLIGDGPAESLGGVGIVPSVDDVAAAFSRVRKAGESLKNH